MELTRLHVACSRVAHALQRQIPVASRLSLFFLAKPIHGVGWHPLVLLALGKVLRITFRQQASLVQRQFEDRQQPMPPLIDPWLAQLKHFTQQGLQGIRLLMNQGE